MKAIVVTDQAAGTAGMKLVERPEPQAARLASLSGASPEVAADAQTYAELEASAGRRHGGYRPAVRVLLRTGHLVPPRRGVRRQGPAAGIPNHRHGSGVWSWVHVEDAALATVEITWRGKTVYTSVWQEPVQLRTNRR